MKKTILIMCLFLAACNNKAKHKTIPADTTKVLAVYNLDQLRADTVYRVTKDTLKLSKVDSLSGSAKLKLVA
jgi:hypothetical protein